MGLAGLGWLGLGFGLSWVWSLGFGCGSSVGWVGFGVVVGFWVLSDRWVSWFSIQSLSIGLSSISIMLVNLKEIKHDKFTRRFATIPTGFQSIMRNQWHNSIRKHKLSKFRSSYYLVCPDRCDYPKVSPFGPHFPVPGHRSGKRPADPPDNEPHTSRQLHRHIGPSSIYNPI